MHQKPLPLKVDPGPGQQLIRAQLPDYLQQFVANNDYRRYTPRDQAVWRYVLGELNTQLRDIAHPVYFAGLEKSGINCETIPSVDEMNACLQQFGWRVIHVDGFIPPQAFMELQSLKILAVAQDIRSVDQINYTAAPDIIHEAAGHAPIIADAAYAEYLQNFGAVGMYAMYNQWDLDMYEAVREVSLVKACETDGKTIQAAEERLGLLLRNPGEISELAMLSRLHWWTIEYGLVNTSGIKENNKIFGAGLLSSITESLSCMDHRVKKKPLTVAAVRAGYDITQVQPQLFVTRGCDHLNQVLEEFAATMCYRQGGAESIRIAIESKVVTTLVYSSGLQVSGLMSKLVCNTLGQAVFISTIGSTQLSLNNVEMPDSGIEQLPSGWASPVGRLCNLMKPLELASDDDLLRLGIVTGEAVCLAFLSGILVKGNLVSVLRRAGKIVIFRLRGASIRDEQGKALVEATSGYYDMAVGESIVSVFSGSADKSKFNVYPPGSTRKAPLPGHSKADLAEFDIYQRVRQWRQKIDPIDEGLVSLVNEAIEKFPLAWLLHVELLELCQQDPVLVALLEKHRLASVASRSDPN
ncbi:MAG: aromatic amino acid hydroxylase [Pseudomonadales bacterium]|nr:aromatic amino acid hydroxylase [Pseudomonadales bacterium]